LFPFLGLNIHTLTLLYGIVSYYQLSHHNNVSLPTLSKIRRN